MKCKPSFKHIRALSRQVRRSLAGLLAGISAITNVAGASIFPGAGIPGAGIVGAGIPGAGIPSAGIVGAGIAGLAGSTSVLTGCSTPSKNQQQNPQSSDTGQQGNQNSSDSRQQSEENNAFEEFAMEVFRDTLAQNGLAVHSYLEHPENYGITDYPLTIGEYDLDSLGDTSDLTNTLTRLKSFNRELLSDKHKLTYDEILYTLETELEYSDIYLYNTSLSTTIGEQIQLPLVLAEYTFKEEKDVEEYLAIAEDVDKYFTNVCEYEKLRADAGIFMEDYLADKIIEQCNTFIENASDGFLISTFVTRLDALGLSDAKRNEYIRRNQTAVDEHVIKGYEILRDGLRNLKGSGKYSGGIGNYPDGLRYYEYFLASNLGWNKSLDEFAELITGYINKTILQIQKIATEHPDSYNKASTFSFQQLSPEDTLEQLKKLIKDNYPDGPDVDYTISYVDKSISESASPAMYFTPQIDNIEENSIYINPENAGSADLYATLAHEGFPGHLYQTTYFAASDPDLIRYVIAPTGYVEGWATYIEVDSYRYAETGDEYLNELMGLNYALTLLLYASVDMGVSCYGWSEDDVYNFVSSFGFRGKRIAKEMYDAMVSEPGNYCRYVLGYIAILELQDKAKELLGNRYSAKEFNKFLLDTGAIQFDILFNRLDEWAAAY